MPNGHEFITIDSLRRMIDACTRDTGQAETLTAVRILMEMVRRKTDEVEILDQDIEDWSWEGIKRVLGWGLIQDCFDVSIPAEQERWTGSRRYALKPAIITTFWEISDEDLQVRLDVERARFEEESKETFVIPGGVTERVNEILRRRNERDQEGGQ